MRNSQRFLSLPLWSTPLLLLTLLGGHALGAMAASEPLVASIDGHWVGFEERAGRKLAVSLDLAQKRPFLLPRVEYFCPMDTQVVQGSPGTCPVCYMPLVARPTGNGTGQFTSESQGVSEYPLDTVSYSPPKLHLELGNGDTTFDGNVSGDTIVGTITQKDGNGTFLLRREIPGKALYNRSEVTFGNGAVRLSGTLLIPLTPTKHAAVVLVHGSGAQTRWGTPLFFAERFAREGIAALVFDKRGSGKSTGDWKTATPNDLADDVVAAIDFLRRQSAIDPEQIGIYGHSEGAMIAPLIAARSRHVAFIIAADGHAGPLIEQELYRVRNVLSDHGFGGDQAQRALAFYGTWVNVAATGTGWNLLERLVPRVRNEKWFSLVEPPAREDSVWQIYPARAAYDSLSYWTEVAVPVLIVFGEADRTVNPKTGVQRTMKALAAAGNHQVTAVIIPRAQHNLTISPDPGAPFEWWRLAPGYPELLVSWVLRNTSVTRAD